MQRKKNGERRVEKKNANLFLCTKRKKGKYGRFLKKKSVSIYKFFKFVTYC